MKILLSLFGLFTLVCIIAGCVNTFEHSLSLPTVAPGQTTVPEPLPPPPPPTEIATSVPTIPAESHPPSISTAPPIYAISIQVQKNTVAIDPWISALYEGSSGLVLPSRIDLAVIRSDGTTERESAFNPARGTRILLNGTTGTDRVIVTVTYLDGSVYTVKDERLLLRAAPLV
jgi:hypothetical protein